MGPLPLCKPRVSPRTRAAVDYYYPLDFPSSSSFLPSFLSLYLFLSLPSLSLSLPIQVHLFCSDCHQRERQRLLVITSSIRFIHYYGLIRFLLHSSYPGRTNATRRDTRFTSSQPAFCRSFLGWLPYLPAYHRSHSVSPTFLTYPPVDCSMLHHSGP